MRHSSSRDIRQDTRRDRGPNISEDESHATNREDGIKAGAVNFDIGILVENECARSRIVRVGIDADNR